MTKAFKQGAVAPSTQIGKGGTRIASDGVVSQTRSASGSVLARHQGADAVSADDFITRRQLQALPAQLAFFKVLSLQDQPQQYAFLTHDDSSAQTILAGPTDPQVAFMCPGDVINGQMVIKMRRFADGSDGGDNIECNVWVSPLGSPFSLAYTDARSFSADGDLLAWTPDFSLSAGDMFAIGFVSLDGAIINPTQVAVTLGAIQSTLAE